MMKYLKKLWKDPVGASVIASVIVILLTQLCVAVYSWFGEESFWGALKKISNIEIKLWIVFVLALAYLFIRGLVSKFGSFRYDNHSYENDKAVYDTIYKNLSFDGIIEFLRTNNFAGFPFYLSSLDELDDFFHTYSNDPSFEFLNPKLEVLRLKLMKDIDEFKDLIAVNTFPGSREGLQTVPPEWETKCPEHFWDVVNKIHSAAKNICSDYDIIVRTGKRVINL